jgi:hypothetical protein
MNSDQTLLSYNGRLIGVCSGMHNYGKVFALTKSPEGRWLVADWYLFSEAGRLRSGGSADPGFGWKTLWNN